MGLDEEPEQTGVGVRDPRDVDDRPNSRGGLRLGEGPAEWCRCPAVELPGEDEDEDESTVPVVGQLRHASRTERARQPGTVRESGSAPRAPDAGASEGERKPHSAPLSSRAEEI
ncbi:hypothetical protein Snoj_39310 [Streptomyces nojiriensis]|uniref:Uncharacterized protein n=1 Tax=Streptomyces nojiriensis TaxID=66374 RepID=A0ABQ3SPE6_9ACTN|nr:hypothetical protein GCM10010205_07960 [Streptomyces nojiriensis]GHI70013.1 hypothetical protein Snoj_39310 [Streptomyces nojiriensis]